MYHQEDDFTFDQNSKFEKEMYDFTSSNNIRLMKHMKKGLTFITQNKDMSDGDEFSYPLKCEDIGISDLNQLTKSRSSKALFEGVTSEHWTTSVTTSHDTGKNNIKTKQFKSKLVSPKIGSQGLCHVQWREYIKNEKICLTEDPEFKQYSS